MISTYETFPVWNQDAWQSLESGMSGAFTLLGQDWQHLRKFTKELPEFRHSFQVLCRTLAERQALKTWFDARRGRYGPFWFCPHKVDAVVAALSPAGNGTIQVLDRGHLLGLYGVTRHLYFESTDQAVRVTSVTQGSGVVTLGIDPVLSGALAAGATVRYICLVRFDSDELTLADSDLGVDIAEARIDLVELQRETPDS